MPKMWHRFFFVPLLTKDFMDGSTLDVVECPGGHPFTICTKTSPDKQPVLFVQPISGNAATPSWLPEQYHPAHAEMTFDFLSGKYRSAIAVAGIMLDAHINSLLKYKGDQRKPLKKRLEILAEAKLIDHDQFADGTVARLSRNETIHPTDIAEQISEKDAQETIEAVTGCLERFYKWRRAKALPAPTEKTADPATPEDPPEEPLKEGETPEATK